jgi:ribose 5-phosphate isomerase B
MIVIGSDHGGLDLKTALKNYLGRRGYTVTDAGTDTDSSVDYPDFGQKVAEMVVAGTADSGILICGTGIGMSIAANKVLDEQKACDLVGAWLDATFEGGRHQGRLDKIADIEKKYR